MKQPVTIERETLSMLVSAAEIRGQQWRAVSNNVEPSETIAELYEADNEEAYQMALMIEQAVEQASEVLRQS